MKDVQEVKEESKNVDNEMIQAEDDEDDVYKPNTTEYSPHTEEESED